MIRPCVLRGSNPTFKGTKSIVFQANVEGMTSEVTFYKDGTIKLNGNVISCSSADVRVIIDSKTNPCMDIQRLLIPLLIEFGISRENIQE